MVTLGFPRGYLHPRIRYNSLRHYVLSQSLFVSDQQDGLAGCCRHVVEWIINKGSFVPDAGFPYGFQELASTNIVAGMWSN